MGLPLQVRSEKFTSVGQPETFTKTNRSSDNTEVSRTQRQIESIKSATRKKIGKNSGVSRFMLHAGFIAIIVVAVSAGRVNSQSSLISTNSNNTASDKSSLITTGAVLAEGSSSMISSDLSQKAKDISSQSNLTTSGDDFLSKKQPVTAAGAPSRDILTYVVKDGDTISSLSSKFNITTDTIKWANNIVDENNLKPGAQLVILPVSGVLYTGTGNDDLNNLASTYQANPSIIDSFNMLDGKSPASGQKIVIPDGVKPAAAPVSAVTQLAATGNNQKSGPAISYSLRSSNGNTYAYGYCTWYVANRRYVPGMLGNANQWPYNAPRAGMSVGITPVAGAAGVVRWGNHVVYIESVSGDGRTVYYTEMNGPAGWGRVNTGSAPASNFTYVY